MRFKLFLLLLIIFGFFYRLYGLSENYSFWTDEDHVAIFVRAILERGKPVLANGYSTGIYQWLQYWLSAISAKFFGINEFAIRFPSVIFGVLTILAVYLLGKELFNKNVGLISAFLTAFLKIEILWSRQARPYQALQFFFILGVWFVYKLAKEEKFNWRYFLGFLACGALASLMHGLGLVLFFNGFFYLFLFRLSWFKKWFFGGGLLFLIFGYVFKTQIFSVISSLGKINNLFYYRVFLTHNYLPLVILALIGWVTLFLKNKKIFLLLSLPLIVQGFAASFLLGQPFIRYFYPAFPFLILLSAASLVEISQSITSKFRSLPIGGEHISSRLAGHISLFLLLCFFVFSMANKFALAPKSSYSLNEDMQEIPEVDWKRIYGFVDQKLKQNPGSVLVSNWMDLPVWYLGEGKLNFLIRKPGSIRGKQDPFSSAKMVYLLEEFKKIVKENKKGVLVIDSWDNQIPEGVLEYCQTSLKKELEIDRLYPVQPRYWTVWVYSWGI